MASRTGLWFLNVLVLLSFAHFFITFQALNKVYSDTVCFVFARLWVLIQLVLNCFDIHLN